MDAAATTASWLSFAVTAIGLGSLITQTSAIEERLDPFHTSRKREYLGEWIQRQPQKPRFKLGNPIPVGPIISARLVGGFCGLNNVGISRLPLGTTGKATWTAMLAVFHEQAPDFAGPYSKQPTTEHKPSINLTANGIKRLGSRIPTIDLETGFSQVSQSQQSWADLPTQPLSRNDSSSCLLISRTALITILALCNASPQYRYSDASGHRADYGSYCGHFYINWPLGRPAVVSYAPHDSHSLSTDVYPRMFRTRVDKCIHMLTGVITSPDAKAFKCGFPARKPPGTWILQHQRKGYPGAHGSRHLYYQMGGKAYEVDFLLARRHDDEVLQEDYLAVQLPSVVQDLHSTFLVPKLEQGILELCLDYLPWSSLSWSIHRGLRDILVAFAKPVMNHLRGVLALTLHSTALKNKLQLQVNGWAPHFIEAMADLASNSILAGSGNSGDAVRVVTDVALLSWTPNQLPNLDETTFWREERHRPDRTMQGYDPEPEPLTTNAIIALTKVFVLEWSNEFDYQMNYDLPPQLLFS
ncbi:MAG: hypothetical protein Q9214_004766 [Letrouitia sp. 1 TL-2023]